MKDLWKLDVDSWVLRIIGGDKVLVYDLFIFGNKWYNITKSAQLLVGVLNMELISQIEIRYFRSIYYLKITNSNSLNIFSGGNDAGKSNILKALNLFFNSQTDFKTEVNFYNDFNFSRLREVRQESIKGKQFIQIKITFKRGDRSPNTLPEYFTVTRTWHRGSLVPSQSDDLERRLKGTSITLTKARASLSRFLDTLKYEYIPAIKDNQLFNHIMTDLQEALFNYGNAKGNLIGNKLKDINGDIANLVKKLNTEFEIATGISSSLSLPTNLQSLYTSFLVNTVYGDNEIPLEQRGDGIKVRYIPSILNYISDISNRQFIWGFEEPENSLEYKLCTKMASDFESVYSKGIQIFTTSHSPAFISIQNNRTSLYRVYKQGYQTKHVFLSDSDSSSVHILNEELGLTNLLKEQHEFYLKRMEEIELQRKELQILQREIVESRKPLIMTEGKTDKMILETAWSKLYPDREIPFNISSCDLEDGSSGGGAAGCGILKKQLESVRHDNPNVIIGLFDYDQAGMDAFKLDKNYNLVHGYSNIKRNKNGKGFAVLLPIPEGKEEFETTKNLPIEFYFDEEDLRKEIDGYSLGLIQPIIPAKLNGVIVKQFETTELQYAQIESHTKTMFAEKIVPTFDSNSFKNFDFLFSIFDKIINDQL